MMPFSVETSNRAGEAIRIVDSFFAELFATLSEWRPKLEAELEGRLRDGKLTGAGLAQLVQPRAQAILAQQEQPFYGAGFCGSDRVVTEGNPLSWWQGPEMLPLISTSLAAEAPTIDYRRLEWFRVPESSGERHVAGPYVDYLCSNEITLTSAMPLSIGGEFGGVICVDVLVDELEKRFLPALERLGGDAVLVNADGRVVVSSDLDYATGDRHEGLLSGGNLDECVEEYQVLRSNTVPFAVVARRGAAAGG